MRHWWLLVGTLAAVLLGLFGLGTVLEVPLLTDPAPWLDRGGPVAAATGFALLVGDVLLPVPNTLVMIAHGTLFGFWGGTALSLAGSLAAGWLGFWLGRRGHPLIARVIPAAERARADALLRRWGVLAVVVSRPVPILAETVAIVAGASPLGWGSMTGATVLGSLPAAGIYAAAGATAAGFDHTVLVFGLVLLGAGFTAFVGRRHARRRAPVPAPR